MPQLYKLFNFILLLLLMKKLIFIVLRHFIQPYNFSMCNLHNLTLRKPVRNPLEKLILLLFCNICCRFPRFFLRFFTCSFLLEKPREVWYF